MEKKLLLRGKLKPEGGTEMYNSCPCDTGEMF